MTFRQIWFLISVTLILLGVLIGTAAAEQDIGATVSEYSVGVTSYTIGQLTVNPTSGQVGDRVVYTGTGHLANTPLEVGIAAIIDNELYSVLLANVTTDPAGNWSASVEIPPVMVRNKDDAEFPIVYGEWAAVGIGTGSDTNYYGSETPLTIVAGESTTPTTTYYDTAVEAATLPSTGIPVIAPVLSGIGMLAGAGLAADRWRGRRRR
jgi:LPXTG-motif cell wall-anchored protein